MSLDTDTLGFFVQHLAGAGDRDETQTKYVASMLLACPGCTTVAETYVVETSCRAKFPSALRRPRE